MIDMSVSASLYELFARAFSNEELRIFLALGPDGPAIVEALPATSEPLATFMYAAVEALARHDRVDGELIERLHAARPRRRRDIERVAADLGLTATVEVPIRAASTAVAEPIRTTAAAIPTAVAEIPLGPGVPTGRVTHDMIQAFADASPDQDLHSVLLDRAVMLRQECDPGATVVRMMDLPLVLGAYRFWRACLVEACRHGPRMVAALLLALPKETLTTRVRSQRDALLVSLRDRTYRSDL